ncbi:MAG: hypothetical protein KKF44_00610 [Nanoarchaeota archaeon]|nr:hypothetical protein [Nanoarchaeota archaeon]
MALPNLEHFIIRGEFDSTEAYSQFKDCYKDYPFPLAILANGKGRIGYFRYTTYDSTPNTKNLMDSHDALSIEAYQRINTPEEYAPVMAVEEKLDCQYSYMLVLGKVNKDADISEIAESFAAEYDDRTTEKAEITRAEVISHLERNCHTAMIYFTTPNRIDFERLDIAVNKNSNLNQYFEYTASPEIHNLYRLITPAMAGLLNTPERVAD